MRALTGLGSAGATFDDGDDFRLVCAAPAGHGFRRSGSGVGGSSCDGVFSTADSVCVASYGWRISWFILGLAVVLLGLVICFCATNRLIRTKACGR